MVKLMLDPGHGGSDPGAVNGGYKEKDFNLSIALSVRDYLLKNYEVTVLLTRTKDETVSLSARTDYANKQNVDYFCSIHINAGGGTGFESYIYSGNVTPKTVSYRAIIHDEVMKKIGPAYSVRDRGKKRANFHVLRETKMEAILIETLFIDNRNDLKLLTSDSFMRDYTTALAKGIADALQLPKKNTPPPQPPSDLYKVIAGSFKERENAEKRVETLKNNQIDSFIVPVSLNGETYYRVQAGAYSEKKNAEIQVENLKSIGITDAFILSPTPSNNEQTNENQEEPTKEPPSQAGYPILGSPILLGNVMDQFVRTINPDAPSLGDLYIELGKAYNIRGDIAFAQAILETNYFRYTGDVAKEQNNYAGIGATGGGVGGASFQTEEEGVLAQLQHLFAYASTKPLPSIYPLVDPRFNLVKRGSATTWQALNGKWAVPGDTYGQLILNIYLRMISFAKETMTNEEKAIQQTLKN